MIKEACVESFSEAMIAIKRGANRIELCENLNVGGTTPSYGSVKRLVEATNTPIVVMIRPRGGNFTYTEDEIELMIEDIRLFNTLDIDGFVLGVLDNSCNIDYKVLKRLIGECNKDNITFHKAIDELENPIGELKRLANLGITRVLTSGRKNTAIEGTDLINAMCKVEGGPIIVAAGKITSENLEEVSSLISTNEFHGKLIV